jgi:hypothetical protein
MRFMRILLAITVQSFVVLSIATIANAQLPAFPGAKVFSSGINPVGIGKSVSTAYSFTINLNAGFDNTKDLYDVVPAEFDVESVTPTCGAASYFEMNKQAGVKLSPDAILWDLAGCDNTAQQTLTVSLVTDQNPGHGKRGIAFFEPTSCGPLYLNDGAVLFDPVTASAVTERSNSLLVATCPVEGDPTCIDQDGDGWSVACGDPDDTNPAITPVDVDGDGIANESDPCLSDPTNTCVS